MRCIYKFTDKRYWFI